jgi:hypothetical protein
MEPTDGWPQEMSKRKRMKALKRKARRIDGTVFQQIGASKYNPAKKWQGRWKSGAGKSWGAALEVRHIDPTDYKPSGKD